MKRSVALMLFVAVSLSFAATVTGQQTVRSALRTATDRPVAPSFGLSDAGNRHVGLQDFRGKPVVLNLWATECGGCKTELPTFIELDRVYKNKGLVVLGVSMDIMYSDLKSAKAGWERVNPFVSAHQIDYPILLDDGSVEKAFKVTALPATYVIDKTGRIAASYIGIVDPGNLEANIKTLLAER